MDNINIQNFFKQYTMHLIDLYSPFGPSFSQATALLTAHVAVVPEEQISQPCSCPALRQSLHLL